MELKETRMEYFMGVPDIISLLNLSFGFLAILMAINNQIAISAILIIFALIFDSVDGWVARKLSRIDEHGFGKNIDSLADIVSFGVAPGILLYFSGKNQLESFGLGSSDQFHYLDIILALVALFVVICGVLRLTRFNVIADKVNFNGFIGLPIPACGIVLSTFILSGFFNIYVAMVLMIIIGLLMISNIRYRKLNDPKILIITGILIFLVIIPYQLIYMGINVFATIVFIIVMIYIILELFRELFVN
jgi:archaetidylserine synthase